MKILLFGCNGQVGWELQRALALLGDVVALDIHNTEINNIEYSADFSRPEMLPRILHAVQPDVIVNAAAHTAVDKAEAEPALAHAINAEAPGLLAQTAASLNAWFVHYSTDYVFDGSGSTPWNEDSVPRPLNVYGRTKLEGEQRVRASGCRHLIFRTSWVYSARGNNFARTMLKLAAQRDELNVVSDQIGAPTGADTLADLTALALRTVQAAPALGGTYHAAAAGETSWHDYAKLVIGWARAQGLPTRFALDKINAVPSSAYPTAARRPLNSRLNTQRLQQTFGLKMPPWQAGVLRMLATIHATTHGC